MVVLFQFAITRWIVQYRPLIVMAVGTLLYAIGFAMYGFVSGYVLFIVAMVIITIGEMVVVPTSEGLVARLAPEDKRGRYMAVFGFTWVIPSAVGPLLAGLIMDNADPRLVWYAAGLLGLIATGAFALLERRVGRSTWAAVDERVKILQMLEEGKVSAQEAAGLLQAIGVSQWAGATAGSQSRGEVRRVRIRFSDLASCTTKADVILPMGLVHTVFYTGGRLSDDLEALDLRMLEDMVASSEAGDQAEVLDTGDDQRVEVSVE
jgi:MFS family permease